MFFLDKLCIRLGIDKNTDPLKYLEDEGTDINDAYAKNFFQSLYGVITTIFWAGTFITLLICFIRYMIAGKGNERKEHQMAVVFKVFLAATFSILPNIISFIMRTFL